MSLLVLTAACAMIARPAGIRARAAARTGRRRRAGLRRRQCSEPRARPGHRSGDGPADSVAPRRRRAGSRRVGRCVRVAARGPVVRDPVGSTNLLGGAPGAGGGAFYVVVYTLGLKRRTSQNIVIGGAAGAIPCSGRVGGCQRSPGLGALYLFAIVLVWTPPHFWSLALLLAPPLRGGQRADAARRPRPERTARQVLLYTLSPSR